MSHKSRGKHRGNATRQDVMRRRDRRGGGIRMDIVSDTEKKRDDRLPDRQTALLQAIKEILGMTYYSFL